MTASRAALGRHVFAIELHSPQGAAAEDGRAAEGSGRISIGDFTEAFRVPLGFWHESGYRRSWRRAFEVLNADPGATSCGNSLALGSLRRPTCHIFRLQARCRLICAIIHKLVPSANLMKW